MPDHPDYHGRGWRSKKQEDDEDAQKQEGLAKQQAAGTATRAQTREKGIGGGADIWEDVDVEGADGGSSSDSGSEPDSSDEDQAPGRARTFKPMPPPRRKLEPVQISFTKLETDVLPARENRGRSTRRTCTASLRSDHLSPLFLRSKLRSDTPPAAKAEFLGPPPRPPHSTLSSPPCSQAASL